MDELPESIPVEFVKGIPNFITARKTIEEMKRREIVTAAAENRPVRDIRYCQYCGGRKKSQAALNGHLRACSGRAKVRAAAAEGVIFTAGRVVFTVRLKSVKLLAGLTDFERELAGNVAKKDYPPESAAIDFFMALRGATMTAAAGTLSFEHRPAESNA